MSTYTAAGLFAYLSSVGSVDNHCHVIKAADKIHSDEEFNSMFSEATLTDTLPAHSASESASSGTLTVGSGQTFSSFDNLARRRAMRLLSERLSDAAITNPSAAVSVSSSLNASFSSSTPSDWASVAHSLRILPLDSSLSIFLSSCPLRVDGLLIDDGFRFPDCLSLSSFSLLVSSQPRRLFVRRILRIESFAEEIIRHQLIGSNFLTKWEKLVGAGEKEKEFENEAEKLFHDFNSKFLLELEAIVESKEGEKKKTEHDFVPVVALKSIICYRSQYGLRIPPEANLADAKKQFSLLLRSIVQQPSTLPSLRLGSPFDALLHLVFLTALTVAHKHSFPFQLHAGFGDSDLDLLTANPLHLRALLSSGHYNNARIILLHACYPYAAEAAYLSSIYPSVFVDFSLVGALTSTAAARHTWKALLSTAPLEKILCSTDAHHFPAMWYLSAYGNVKSLADALSEAVNDGDINEAEARNIGVNILRNTAIRLYHLEGHLPLISLQSLALPPSMQPSAAILPASVEHVRILWIDGVGIRRCRVLPRARYVQDALVGVGLTQAAMALPVPYDVVAPASGLSAAGEVRLVPLQDSVRVLPYDKSNAIVLSQFLREDGKDWECCPRAALKALVEKTWKEFAIELQASFEYEFVLLRPIDSSIPASAKNPNVLAGRWIPVDSSTYCSSLAVQHSSHVVQEMVSTLNSVGVEVEQWHSEAAPGQFEISVRHRPILQAADNYVVVKEIVANIADRHGLRATFTPKLWKLQAGSGTHIHFSLNDGKGRNATGDAADKDGLSALAKQFMAGLLLHLPGVLSFTASTVNSYARLQPQCWASASVSWGRQDREAALRTVPKVSMDAFRGGLRTSVEISNVELKPVDGAANPYLALSALLASGLDGLKKQLKLSPSASQEEEKGGSIVEGKFPESLKSALDATLADQDLCEYFPPALVKAVIGTRQAEVAAFAEQTHEQIVETMIERI